MHIFFKGTETPTLEQLRQLHKLLIGNGGPCLKHFMPQLREMFRSGALDVRDDPDHIADVVTFLENEGYHVEPWSIEVRQVPDEWAARWAQQELKISQLRGMLNEQGRQLLDEVLSEHGWLSMPRA